MGPPLAPIAHLPDRLNSLLSERLPAFQGRILSDAGRLRLLPVAVILEHDHMGECLSRFARSYSNQDPRAVASLWAQWYLATTWPPLVAAALLLKAVPRLAEADLLFDQEERPVGLKIPAEAEPGSPQRALELLIWQHGAPLLHAAAMAGGVSPRVLWSNASNVFAWTLQQLAALADPGQLEPAYAILEQRCLPDGRRNPLYLPETTKNATDVLPPRKVCCLRYLLNDFDYCSNCPIKVRRRTRAD